MTHDELRAHPGASRFYELRAQYRVRVAEHVRAARAHEAAGGKEPSADLIERLNGLHDLYAEWGRELEALHHELHIPAALLLELKNTELPELGEFRPERDVRLYRRRTADLDALAAHGYEQLRKFVNAKWLADYRSSSYRLGDAYLSQPQHIYLGGRVQIGEEQPQRFAHMLLTCEDHLSQRPDADFFAAPMLLNEVAMLGLAVDALTELGPVAEQTFRDLPRMTDDKVASTIHELLVGAACVRKGLGVEMLEASGGNKSPDYLIRNLDMPGAIECKRRIGPSEYEQAETRHVTELYYAIAPVLEDQGLHVAIEVQFAIEVLNVSLDEFVAEIVALIQEGVDGPGRQTRFGQTTCVRLPFVIDLPRTRLYSPDFMTRVFNWAPNQDQWDGIVCQVDAPNRVLTGRARNPRCLKWVSLSEQALIKKARGVTSLWADATQQIPAGHNGFVYIAYPEGNRSTVAAARSNDIAARCSEWFHRWSVRIPLSVVSRLYPITLGAGRPGLIESSLPIHSEEDLAFLAVLPIRVFTTGPPE